MNHPALEMASPHMTGLLPLGRSFHPFFFHIFVKILVHLVQQKSEESNEPYRGQSEDHRGVAFFFVSWGGGVGEKLPKNPDKVGPRTSYKWGEIIFIRVIRLMEEILHHLGYKKPCKSWDVMNYLSSGAGFLPSTVSPQLLKFYFRPFIGAHHPIYNYTPGSTNIAIAGRWGPRIESMYGSDWKWGCHSSNRYVIVYQSVTPISRVIYHPSGPRKICSAIHRFTPFHPHFFTKVYGCFQK